MADKHPYPYTSGSASLFEIVEHLRRKSFPAAGVDAATLKKVGIAPNNESYLINILRFIGVLADDGSATDAASKAFSQHKDEAFQRAFGDLVQNAYKDLFALHKDESWTLDRDELIHYFRTTDGTSALVGTRQARTFQALAAISGHGDAPPQKATKKPAPKKANTKKPAPKKKKEEEIQGPTLVQPPAPLSRPRDLGLTVRIEINLPSEGDQETYDRIFKSIRTNLIDAD